MRLGAGHPPLDPLHVSPPLLHSQLPRSRTPPLPRSRTPPLLHSQTPPPLLHSQTLPPPHSQTPLQSVLQDDQEPSVSEEAPDLEPEIDEQSDDEDDRRAHAFLHASPNQVTVAAVSRPPPPAVRGLTAAAAPQLPAHTVQGAATAAAPQLLAPAGWGHLGFTVSYILHA